ncbi:hypothetical protein ElyMa_003058600 [Elysia marginata]|uniref:Reverse transcriptase zinc-binding domain-containing protein n=1 Tax=Elysia marginata TaxID=1093978 RepID=A0AAV4IJR4_9GAST|nr:hypothetical protein ElyMa_003058600 [Elysia marginata]
MLDQFDTAIDFASAKNVVRKHVLKTVWASQNVHESQPTGIRPPPRRDKESGLTRRERVVLAQLRCNEKSPILQQYLYSTAAADSKACLTCGASPDNLDHVLKKCPTGTPYRDSLPENPRDVLWTDPVRVVEFLRACDSDRIAKDRQKQKQQQQLGKVRVNCFSQGNCNMASSGIEPATSRSRVRRANNSATLPLEDNSI